MWMQCLCWEPSSGDRVSETVTYISCGHNLGLENSIMGRTQSRFLGSLEPAEGFYRSRCFRVDGGGSFENRAAWWHHLGKPQGSEGISDGLEMLALCFFFIRSRFERELEQW
jgi:hypothetical protein